MNGRVVGDWQLERYRLAELPASEQEAVRAAIAVDEGLRERLAALDQSDREILARNPPAAMAAAIWARTVGREALVARPKVLAGALASALAVSLVLATASAVLVLGRRGRDAADVTRVKGLSPRLYVFRKGPASAAEPLVSGAVAREHDVVQLAYQAAGRRFGAIVSIDGRQVVTRHLPATGAAAATLAVGPPVALAEAYRLDDAPGFERFYLVTADVPFAVDDVVAAVRRGAVPGNSTAGGRLDLPPSLDQFVFVLEKEGRR
jgi:hypothetical protein